MVIFFRLFVGVFDRVRVTKHLRTHSILTTRVKRASDNPPTSTTPYRSHGERENVDKRARKVSATQIHPILAPCPIDLLVLDRE